MVIVGDLANLAMIVQRLNPLGRAVSAGEGGITDH
jgi:hypothetical protein